MYSRTRSQIFSLCYFSVGLSRGSTRSSSTPPSQWRTSTWKTKTHLIFTEFFWMARTMSWSSTFQTRRCFVRIKWLERKLKSSELNDVRKSSNLIVVVFVFVFFVAQELGWLKKKNWQRLKDKKMENHIQEEKVWKWIVQWKLVCFELKTGS